MSLGQLSKFSEPTSKYLSIWTTDYLQKQQLYGFQSYKKPMTDTEILPLWNTAQYLAHYWVLFYSWIKLYFLTLQTQLVCPVSFFFLHSELDCSTTERIISCHPTYPHICDCGNPTHLLEHRSGAISTRKPSLSTNKNVSFHELT